MNHINYSVVNVFTNGGKNGNPLGVVTDTRGLNKKTMQAIAKKLDFSETSFIFPTKNQNADYRVRFFTPEEEIPFAGHPSIGTLFYLRQEGLVKKKKNYVQMIGRRLVPLSLLPDGRIRMDQGKPRFLQKVSEIDAAKLLALGKAMVTGVPRVITTGLQHLIIPLKSLNALKKSKLNGSAYKKIIRLTGAGCVMPFAVKDGKLFCRMYAPALGVDEDPATGSGCGPLAAYVADGNIVKCKRSGKTEIKILQGAKALSLLSTWVTMKNGKVVKVEVGGFSKKIASKRLSLVGLFNR